MIIRYKIDAEGRAVILKFDYDEKTVGLVKAIEGRVYLPEEKAWRIPEGSFYDLQEDLGEEAYFIEEGKEEEGTGQKNRSLNPRYENKPLPEDKYLPDGKLYVSWYTGESLRLDFNYNEEFLSSVKDIKGRRFVKETEENRFWVIPKDGLKTLTDYYAPSTFIFLGKGMDSLRYVPKEAHISLPEAKLPPFKTEPFPHQREALIYALANPACLIGDEQGLGKTWVAINAMGLRKKKIKKCLIVCGVNTVKYNWKKEISAHSDEDGIILDGSNSTKRIERIKKWIESDIYFGILNIEALRSPKILTVLMELIKKGVIGGLVVDEIHKAKNARSHQGKALVCLRPPYRIGLSGTPINKPEELWNILTWLGAESRKEYPWRRQYCVMGGFQKKSIVAYKNHIELRDILQKCMIRRRKEDVIDLPEKLHQQIYVELSPSQKTLYDEAMSGLITSLDEVMMLPNPLTATLRLRQITDGLFTDTNPKLDRVRELLTEEILPSGKKAILFSNWRAVTDMFYEALADLSPAYIHGGMKKEDIIRQENLFQNSPDCPIIIGTISAMGTGLTLNKASYVIFIDQSWVPADNEQAEDRAHRIGVSGTVSILSLIAKDTIDEYIVEHVSERKAAFSYFVEHDGENFHAKAATVLADFATKQQRFGGTHETKEAQDDKGGA